MIRFQAPQFPPVEAVAAYFARAEEERWYSNGGPCYLLLVDRLEDYLGHGVRCVPLANCTLALALGLRALTGPERERQEVLMPSFTFAAVASAAIWAGLQPVFVDIDALTWHLCPEALTDALSQRGAVGAILACSTFGVPPPISVRRQWEATALEAGVPLLVDSAAGFGSMDEQGQRLGHQGQAEVFSFHATKPFAIGEGGLLATRDQRIASHVSRLANFGLEDGIVRVDVGLNAKLDEWSAATALAVLDSFETVLAARRVRAEAMVSRLEPLGFTPQGGSGGGVWQFVPLAAPSPSVRDEALERTRARGIELRSYFSWPLHTMPAFAGCPRAGSLRRTEDLAGRIISLPMANDLSEAEIDRIVACVSESLVRQ